MTSEQAGQQPVSGNAGGAAQQTLKLPTEKVVVALFALLGLLGCVFLALKTSAPPIVDSVFLASGVAALVYGFLGGIVEATFTTGALRLGGVIAALVGSAILFNPILSGEQGFRLANDDTLVGEWRWIYAAEGWEGHLDFTKIKGQYRFTGEEFKWINGKMVPLLDLSNGTARLVSHNQLQLEADVHDKQYNSNYHWVSTASFPLVPAFRGELRRNPDDGLRWGMMIYKWPE